MHPILPRTAAALVAIFTLTGSVVVSCDGDSNLSSGGGGQPGDRPASRAFGLWTPPQAQSGETICTKEQHDRYFVLGPDGKKYPTWHPPALTSASGAITCVFGHDHGADPSQPGLGYDGWDEVRRHFGFDANGNGAIDTDELATSGIPFGYVNEAATGTGAPLTERHEAYKIIFANDRRRDRTINNQQVPDVSCDQLVVFNQDSATADAFTNNRYSVMVAADCASNGLNAGLPAYRAKVIVSALVNYGVANAIVDATSPTSTTGRLVPTQQRAFNNILVASGQTSDYAAGLRERWNGTLSLTRSGGAALASIDMGVGTTDPARFVVAATTLTLRNSIDLCYIGLDAAGNEVTVNPVRLARGSTCESLPIGSGTTTGSGPSVLPNSRVTATSRDSPFRGCQRAAWFGALTVRNNAGPRIWYSDITGSNASPSFTSGTLKHLVDISDTGNSVLLEDQRLDFSGNCARVLGVRAPN